MPEPTYAVFEREEHAERLGRLRAFLRQGGHSGAVLMAPEHLYYFGGYDSWVSVNSPQAMIVTDRDDEPTLILRDVDLPLARETSWIGDLRTYSLVIDDYPSLLRDVLVEKGICQGTLLCELQSYAVPFALGQSIAEAVQPAQLVDATRSVGLLRLIKSPAELRLLEEAAGHAGAGLAAFAHHVEPGITEIELAGRIETAMRGSGSEYPAIPTELSSGARSAGGHATPRLKDIAEGDLVHAEFAGVQHRYHAVGIQTVSCGHANSECKALYSAGLQSLRAGIEAIRPGIVVAEIEEASLAPLRATGLEGAAMMRFGYGIGVAYPPIWLEALQIARGFDETLSPGMAFVLHACLELPDENLGVVLGGTYVLEATGLRLLAGAGAAELLEL
ncbi:MAG: Xaa-Pro peptidase family protein [Pseudomonadota bacterium]